MTDVLVAPSSTFWEIGPADQLPYVFDWTAWLDPGDTIVSFTVTRPSGLGNVSGKTDEQVDPGRIRFWAQLDDPDTVGDSFVVACQITTGTDQVKTRRRRVKAVLR